MLNVAMRNNTNTLFNIFTLNEFFSVSVTKMYSYISTQIQSIRVLERASERVYVIITGTNTSSSMEFVRTDIFFIVTYNFNVTYKIQYTE